MNLLPSFSYNRGSLGLLRASRASIISFLMHRALTIDDIVYLIATEAARDEKALSSDSLKALALVQRSWTRPALDILWSHIGVNQLVSLAKTMTCETYYVQGDNRCRFIRMVRSTSRTITARINIAKYSSIHFCLGTQTGFLHAS